MPSNHAYMHTAATHIAPAEREHMMQYLRGLADRLYLHAWEIVVHQEPLRPEDNAHAMVRMPAGVRNLVLRLDAEWRTWSPEQMRFIFTHELLHAHTESAWDVVQVDMSDAGLLAPAQQALINKVFSREMEYVVDIMTRRQAPHMPLPPLELLPESPARELPHGN